MSNVHGMHASKPLAFNEIQGARESPPNTAKNLGQRVENFAQPRPSLSYAKRIVQYAEHLFRLLKALVAVNTVPGKMLFNILNRYSII